MDSLSGNMLSETNVLLSVEDDEAQSDIISSHFTKFRNGLSKVRNISSNCSIKSASYLNHSKTSINIVVEYENKPPIPTTMIDNVSIYQINDDSVRYMFDKRENQEIKSKI